MHSTLLKTSAAILAMLGLAASSASAVAISGSVSAGFTTEMTYDLTDYGTLDWAYWSDASTANATIAATNSMSGSNLISDLYAIGGDGLLKGSASTTTPYASYTFTNGTDPEFGSVSRASGIFNSSTATVGAGIGENITLSKAGTYTIYVWGATYRANETTFTATIGDQTYTSNSIVAATTENSKRTYLATLSVTSDEDDEVVTIGLVSDAVGGQYSNVLISGVAVAIPEVSTAAFVPLGLLSLLGALLYRRHRGCA